MNKSYMQAVEMADILMDQPSTTPEQLVLLGYRAALEEAEAAVYQSVTAERGNPGQILAVALSKMQALSIKMTNKAKELKV